MPSESQSPFGVSVPATMPLPTSSGLYGRAGSRRVGRRLDVHRVAGGRAADVTALGKTLVMAHPRPASRIFARTYATDAGRTAPACPDSAASSNDAYPWYLRRANAAKTGARSRWPRP